MAPFVVDRLEDRLLLSVDLTQFQQLSTAVNDVQGVVSTYLNANPLPVLGNNLSNKISAFSSQFSTLANTVSTDLQNAVDNVPDVTSALTQAALKNIDGSALSTIADNNSDVEYDSVWNGSAIVVNPTVTFNLGLAALGLNFNGDIKFDVSVTPKFEIDFGVNSGGFFIDASKTSFQLATSVTIDSSSTGLSGKLANFLEFKAVDSTSNNSVYNPSSPSPAPSATNLNATFAAALTGGDLTISTLNGLSTSGVTMTLNGGLHLGLAMKLGLALDAVQPSNFPTIYANLAVDWSLPNVQLSASGLQIDSPSFGGTPSIAFNNVAVDFGSFFTNYVTPIVQKLYQVTQSLKPIVDFINEPAPIFNSFGLLHDLVSAELDNADGTNPYGNQGDLIQNNTISMGDLFVFAGDILPDTLGGGDYSSIVELAQSFQQIYALEASIGDFSPGNGLLELGSFQVTGDPRGQSSLQGEAGPGSLSDSQVASSSDALLEGNGADPALAALAPDPGDSPSAIKVGPQLTPNASPPAASAPRSGIDFPILHDPSQIFNMLLGDQSINLFTYASPILNLNIPFMKDIDVFPPLVIALRGDLDSGTDAAFSLQGQITVGYDTTGFVDYAADPSDPSKLLDGFYIADSSYLTMAFGLAADASVNLDLIEAGIGGGLYGSLTLSLNDPNQTTDGGKMHLPELKDAFSTSVFGPLQLKAKVDFVINAFITFTLGPFSHTFQENLVDINLINFDSSGSPPSAPVLAQFPTAGSNTLLLNMGPYASYRQNGDTTDDNENFTVSILKTNPDGTENVNVSAYGYNQIYNEVGAVEAFGGNGSNQINIGQGVDVPVLLFGALDPTQTLADSSGDDTINDYGSGPYEIYGGPHDDTIRVNTGNPNDPSMGGTIIGANGNDNITANGPLLSTAKNVLIAGDEYDYTGAPGYSLDSYPTITGGAGNDDIRTYAITDAFGTKSITHAYIDSGGGNDTVTEEGANPQVDTIVSHDGTTGSLTINANNPNNILEVYGTGGQNTISAADSSTVNGGTNHGLIVTAAAGAGSTATSETIHSSYGNTSGIINLVLDASGEAPTGSNSNVLGNTVPAGAIYVNVADLTQSGVADIDVNTFAATFPSSTANPTILTITGDANPTEVVFNLLQSTTTVNTYQASSQAPSTTSYTGSTLYIGMANGVDYAGFPQYLEQVSFGESLNDQVIYNAGPGTKTVYFYGTPSNAGASLIYNNPVGATALVYVESLGQPTAINQNGGNLTVNVTGPIANAVAPSPNFSYLTIGGAVPDTSSPTGFDGTVQLIVDDSADTANRSVTIFSKKINSSYLGEITGLAVPLAIEFTFLTAINFTLGSGTDTVEVELGTPIPTDIQCGTGADTVDASNAANSKYPVTVLGGSGVDVIDGSGLGDDIIGGTSALNVTEVNSSANGPGDTILGGSGNDSILAYGGDEYINGGAGDDTIIYGLSISGGQISPTLVGGAGSDTIIAYGGAPLIYTDKDSGSGADQGAINTVEGTATQATIYGSAGADFYKLGAGSTTLPGTTFSDPNSFGPTTIYFGTGSAVLNAAPAVETLYCAPGGTSTDYLGSASASAPLMTPMSINSGTLTVVAAGVDASNYDVKVSTGAALVLDGSLTAGSLTGSGAVSFYATAIAAVLTAGVDNSSTTFTGNISGNGSITKTGTGTWTLSGSNTYTGSTTINSGILQAGIVNVLPASTNVIINNGAMVVSPATFDLNNLNQTIGSLSGNGNVTQESATLTTGGNNSSTTFSGPITGAAASTIVKVGTGTWTLAAAGISNNNNFNISNGTVSLGATNALATATDLLITASGLLSLNAFSQTIGSLAGAGNVALGSGTLTTGGDNASTTFTGLISGMGGVTKTGTGTFTCLVPAYVGPTNVQGGTFRLTGNTNPTPALYYSFNNPLDTSGTVTNDGTLAGKNGSIYNAKEVSGVTGAPGGGNVLQLNNSSGVVLINQSGGSGVSIASGAWTASLWFNGLYPPTSGSGYRTAFHSDSSNDAPAVVQSGGYALGSYLTNAFHASSYNVNSASLNVTTGWHQLTAVGTAGASPMTTFYIDGSAVGSIASESTTEISSIGNYYVAPNQTFANYIADVGIYQVSLTPAQVLSLYQHFSQVNSMPSAITVAGGAVFDVNSLTTAIGSLAGAGSVTLGAGTLTTGTDNTNTTFSGVISNSGSVIKTGTGTWTVSGTNTYTGSITDNAGTINFNAISALGAGTAINFGGGTLQYASGNTTDISVRTVTINAGGATIDTNGNNVSYVNSIGHGGAGGFTKAGLGTLTLQAAGTWTGTATAITGGVLQAGVVSVLPAASNLTVGVAGTFDLNSLNQSIGSLAGAGAVTMESATLTSGAGGNTTSTTFSGTISGSGKVIKTGASVLTLSGSSTYTGGSIIDEEAFGVYAAAYGLSVSADANLGAPGGVIQYGSAAGVLFVTGSFATSRLMTLLTDNNSFPEYLSVAAGQTLTDNGVIANSSLTTRIPDLQKLGAGTLLLNGVNTFGASDGSTDFTLAGGTVKLGVAKALGNITVGFAGSYPTTEVLDLNGINLTVGGITGGYSAGTQLGNITNSSSTPTTLTLDGNGYSNEYDGSITGPVAVVVSGASQAFGGPTTGLGHTATNYSGGTTILSGTLEGAFLSTLSGSTIVNGSFGTGAIVLGAPTGTGNSTLELYGGATEYNPISMVAGNTGTDTLTTFGSSGNIFGGLITLAHSATVGGAVFSGGITGNGNVTFSDNAGYSPSQDQATTLPTANTYVGTTTIQPSSIVILGTNNALPTSTAVTMNFGAAAGNLNLNNYSQTVASLAEAVGGDASRGALNLGSGALTVGGDNTSTTFYGVIAGTGSVTKVGSGTLTLGGANTATGPLNINAGAVVIGDGTTHGAWAGNIAVSNAAVGFNLSSTLTYAGSITGTGTLNQLGNGILILSVPGLTGSTNILAGTLRITTPLVAMASAVNVGLGATFDINSLNVNVGSISGAGSILLGSGQLTCGADSTSTEFDGVIGGAGSLTKVGAGTLILGGQNTYTGPTNINAGALQISKPTVQTAPTPAVLYTFNDPNDTGTAVVNDGSLANRNATLSNATEVANVPGAPGGGKVFAMTNTSGELLTNLVNSKGVDISGGAWTASLWFDSLYANSSSSDGYRTAFHSAATYDAQGILNSSSLLGSYIINGYVGSSYNAAAVATGWHQLLIEGKGGQTFYYIDNSLVSSINSESTSDIDTFGNYNGNKGEPFAKYLADIDVYQSALTRAQMQALYVSQGGSLPDGSLASTSVTVAQGASLSVNDNTGLSPLTALISNGTTTFAANAGTGFLQRSLGSISISAGGRVNISPAASPGNRTLLVTGSLSFSRTAQQWGGLLDMTNNDLDVQGGILANLTSQLATGSGSGNWDGTAGIVSSAAASDPTHLTALGAIQNSGNGLPTGVAIYGVGGAFSSFDGDTATLDSDVLIKYTYLGDTNLDGQVDGSDYTRMDNGYNNQLTGWANGDFNYDTTVDGSDYTLIDNAFNTQGKSFMNAVEQTAVSAPAPSAVIASKAIIAVGKQPNVAKPHVGNTRSAKVMTPAIPSNIFQSRNVIALDNWTAGSSELLSQKQDLLDKLMSQESVMDR